ncbi:hypothetical protein [Sphingomonas sp. 1185]|uniref:hypothetical protein n=1 Tax=Sphingomonas sp. 1185 TaxID=3156411 RepID=UPI00339AB932
MTLARTPSPALTTALRVMRPRALLLGAASGAVIGAVLFLLFLLANHAAIGLDLPAARAHVRQAFAEGALQDRDYLKGDTAIGWHQYNDCLILRLALDQRAGATALTVSPLVTPPVEPRTQCSSLRGFLAGERTGTTGYYHRYIHGHTLLARLLLPRLSVAAIRGIYHGLSTLLVLAGIVTGLLALVRGRRRAEGLFWLIVFLAFARGFGLESYGQSLGHGPADIVLIGYLLMLAVMGTGRGIGPRLAMLTAGLFGALTLTFEFLTGGIPLGLAAVIGGLAFAARPGEERAFAPLPVAPLAAYLGAIATMVALKIALVAQVFGVRALRADAGQLQVRLGLDASHGETSDLGIVHMARQLAKGIDGLAAGMPLMAGAVVLIALVAGMWGARRLLARPDPAMRARVVALLLSNGAIAAMLVLFWQHTMIHAWFMERTLVWTIASGFALFALALPAQPAEPGAGCAR